MCDDVAHLCPSVEGHTELVTRDIALQKNFSTSSDNEKVATLAVSK